MGRPTPTPPLSQFLDERGVKGVVALKLLVHQTRASLPSFGQLVGERHCRFATQLGTLHQLDVVEMGVADKCVRLEVHGRRLAGERGNCTPWCLGPSTRAGFQTGQRTSRSPNYGIVHAPPHAVRRSPSESSMLGAEESHAEAPTSAGPVLLLAAWTMLLVPSAARSVDP